jgi:hypothetical protein
MQHSIESKVEPKREGWKCFIPCYYLVHIPFKMKTPVAPVISLLSPSPAASRKAQLILASLCGLETLEFPSALKDHDDSLNESFRSSLSTFSRSWDSVILKCPSTGSLIHLLSDDANKLSDSKKKQAFSLLAITDGGYEKSHKEAVQRFRDLFALKVKERASAIKMKSVISGGLTTEELLRDVSTGGLPMLSLPTSQGGLLSSPFNQQSDDEHLGLKEIVLPYFDFAEYTDGSSLASHFSYARRPAVGVYQWGSSSTRIRPLPTASEDRQLSPPSLVFHCKDFSDVDVGNSGARTAKIGFGGNLSRQQLMLQHEDLFGLDVRFCSSTTVSSAFSEAQDSLLAASLNELQSTNTLLAGGEQAKDDDRILNGDCWIEVRATLKQPAGFLKKSLGSYSTTQRIANASRTPDS